MTSDIVVRAKDFAIFAHESIGQVRKYTGVPYYTHALAVANLVSPVTDNPEVVAAALLHDVVEDTPYALPHILRSFGVGVANLVREVTNVSRPQDGDRQARKAIDRRHLAKASPEGQTIKLADLTHNLSDVCDHDIELARVYLMEKRDLLAVLTRGHPALQAQAHRQLEVCLQQIG